MSEAPSHLSSSLGDIPDLVCLAHLRWQSAFQRPRQLMTRYARTRRVFFVEEPIFDDTLETRILVEVHDGVHVVVVPHLPRALGETESIVAAAALEQLLARERLTRYVLWYYTRSRCASRRTLTPAGVAYDCIDELSTPRGAATELPALERELMRRADVGVHRRAVALRGEEGPHPNIHAVHEQRRRRALRRGPPASSGPPDQKPIPRPRLGFFGALETGWTSRCCWGSPTPRPDWQPGDDRAGRDDRQARPAVRPNIHYLGPRAYAELPL